MKRLNSRFLFAAAALFAVGCKKGGGNEFADATVINVYAPDGAPALAIAKFINDAENFGTGADTAYHVVSPSDIGQAMQRGDGDIVVIPVNAASKLYSVKGYKMAVVITHGNLYVMAKEDYTLEELKGKVVGVINLSNVPGLTFKAILSANGIEYVESDTAESGKVALKGYNDGSELIPALKSNAVTIGVLPEPAANKLTSVASGYRYALSLQELFDSETNSYPQAVLMIKNGILAKYPSIVENVKSKFDSSVAWVKDNIETAVTAINGAIDEGVTPSLVAANLNATVIDNCGIFWQDGEAAKTTVNNYITRIREILPVSANVVTDDFFA